MSVSALKLLGLCSMLFDHVYHIFPELSFRLPDPLRFLWLYFGRLAAPIFLYSLVSGFRHTGDRSRYAFRLLGFALFSQLPYLLFFRAEDHRHGLPLSGFGDVGGNILFTLALGLGMLALVERFGEKNRPLAVLGVVGCMVLARVLDFEGREGYLLIILSLYLLTDGKQRPRWAAVSLLLLAALLGRWRLLTMLADPRMRPSILLNTLGPFLGLCLALFGCNGEKGRGSLLGKWGMYLFYPLHLLALGALGMAMPPRL